MQKNSDLNWAMPKCCAVLLGSNIVAALRNNIKEAMTTTKHDQPQKEALTTTKHDRHIKDGMQDKL